ncbi:hypothetical protein PFISCL1PPCAC_24952 [Pristionchus fissidentatus]|uniref:Gamma-glutamylcyclotransferase family protein n=1 Tax=Pristionchus fissidentatus TaxID=1538716 RepID=A0AAV5WSQ8_9BILA|nr:hypothetical protein PFISCL1PPCAC_24952 [Pristionchus fissidentatus]
MNRLVFVYGTLKRGEPNHRFLEASKGIARYVGTAVLREAYPLVIASKYNIPFLLNKSGEGHRIRGEVYDVDGKTMESLDELEGYPDLYTREEKEVEMADRSVALAWVYILRNHDEKLLATATVPLDEYRSMGDHGRPYVDGEDCGTYEDLFR